MKKVFATLTVLAMLTFGSAALMAQEAAAPAEEAAVENVDEVAAVEAVEEVVEAPAEEAGGLVALHKTLKTKFIEGDAGFMSLVAIALVLGLAFCIERVIYLTLAQVNTRKFLETLAEKVKSNKIDEAIQYCAGTRGPVAQVSKKAMQCLASDDQNDIATIERSINIEAEVQGAYLEENCSWITLFIAMAPSLGFLGTVIGMVQAFDDIERAGDISPTVVAGGMKVALITTIFGIIVALVLQVFYNYILSRVEALNSNMEETAMSLLEMCVKSPKCKK